MGKLRERYLKVCVRFRANFLNALVICVESARDVDISDIPETTFIIEIRH